MRPGVPPKRSSQRRRTNTPAAGEPVKAPTPAVVEVPEPDEGWYPPALRWYRSLATSGQSAYYADSDWMAAWLLADSISREMKPQPLAVGHGEHAHVEMVEMPPKAASLAAWLKGFTALLATEGDRRRAALELEREPVGEADGDVAWIDTARARFRDSG